MDYLQLPLEEDVDTISIGNSKVSVVKVTNKNKSYLVECAMSMYLGEQCKYCLGVFETIEDLKCTVFAGYHKYGRLAHKICWDGHNKPND